MGFSDEARSRIYDRTGGYCHICGRKVYFQNYGFLGARGAWEVEHSIPWALGGTDHLNNLYAACIVCNRGKGTASTRTVRARNGRSRAPLSRERRKEIRNRNGWAGAAIGLAIGSRLSSGAALVCAVIGGLIGDSIKVR
jgi:5-methylcytosine-specific restriction endonuclease McrA